MARVGFALPLGTRDPNLPQLGTFRVTLAGIDPLDRWRILANPAQKVQPNDWSFGECLVQADADRRRTVLIYGLDIFYTGAKDFALQAVAGVPYNLMPEAAAWEIRDADERTSGRRRTSCSRPQSGFPPCPCV